MRSSLVLACVAALVGAADARAACFDAEGVEVTVDGRCEGTDAVFCGANDTIARLTCANFVVDATLTLHGACAELPSWGAWCTMPEGSPCAFGDGAGGTLQFGCGVPYSEVD